ncbi:MAG: beta-lactamase family protein [Spirochaetales bacterium]|nr:beta-lactamase family protein [Spirochaetales bacterium]
MNIHYGKTDVKPEDVGFEPAALDRLNTHFQNLIGKKIQAAGYILSKDGKVFAHASMGKLSFENETGDFLPDSIRPTASLGKVFTATAILQLMEQGKIYLNQPVCSIIKEFDNDVHKSITIFHLLTHTSGLKAEPGSYLEPYPEDLYSSMDKKNWIKRLLSGTLQYKTGTTWNYCSKGFTFLAEIVSRVSGLDFTDYVEQNIIHPLGMEDTCYFVPEEKMERVCLISNWNKKMLSWKKNNMITTSFKGPAGMVSALTDMWKFGQMMMNGGTFNGKRILGKNTGEAAVKPQIVNYPGHNWRIRMFDETFYCTYGLGWELNKHAFLPDGTFDHEGAEGVGLYMDPQNKFIYAGLYPGEGYCPESWVSPLAIVWSGIL